MSDILTIEINKKPEHINLKMKSVELNAFFKKISRNKTLTLSCLDLEIFDISKSNLISTLESLASKFSSHLFTGIPLPLAIENTLLIRNQSSPTSVSDFCFTYNYNGILLLSKELDEGIDLRIDSYYTAKEIGKWAETIGNLAKNIYLNFIKPVNITVKVQVAP